MLPWCTQLYVLKSAAEKVFVPLTVGGGIRSYVDEQGQKYDACQVADAYFRAGADKVCVRSSALSILPRRQVFGLDTLAKRCHVGCPIPLCCGSTQ